jgi:hypothetical protein
MGTFVQRYGRKTRRGQETTLHASRYMEEKVRRMKPEEFEALLKGEEDEEMRRRDG